MSIPLYNTHRLTAFIDLPSMAATPTMVSKTIIKTIAPGSKPISTLPSYFERSNMRYQVQDRAGGLKSRRIILKYTCSIRYALFSFDAMNGLHG